ncbi:MAG: nucleotide exchange factor GrpE [Candidatus Heimdallarchaeota archaeon]|nr:MAG: nucleotide exchange factor GrpE [Candidatus Heimdallarchaeota archaeon]
MDQKKSKNDESKTEIVDIDYQIEEAANEDHTTSNKTNSENSVLSKGINRSELLDEVQGLYKKLEEKDEQYDKIHRKYLRALADYENLDKRTKANHATIVRQANERLLLKFFDLADSFEKAEKSITSKESINLDSVIEGFRAIHKQFKTILKNEGVEKVAAIGEKFDPNFHEVVFAKPDPDSKEDTILEEVQVGYLLNSRLLRPTKVVVAKNDTKGEN